MRRYNFIIISVVFIASSTCAPLFQDSDDHWNRNNVQLTASGEEETNWQQGLKNEKNVNRPGEGISLLKHHQVGKTSNRFVLGSMENELTKDVQSLVRNKRDSEENPDDGEVLAARKKQECKFNLFSASCTCDEGWQDVTTDRMKREQDQQNEKFLICARCISSDENSTYELKQLSDGGLYCAEIFYN